MDFFYIPVSSAAIPEEENKIHIGQMSVLHVIRKGLHFKMNTLLLSFPDPHLLDSVENEIFYYLCRKRSFCFPFIADP